MWYVISLLFVRFGGLAAGRSQSAQLPDLPAIRDDIAPGLAARPAASGAQAAVVSDDGHQNDLGAVAALDAADLVAGGVAVGDLAAVAAAASW